MVGRTLACTLGKNTRLSQKNILLLEASPNKPWKLPDKYSNRVVSINPGNQKLFKDIGAWSFIEKCRYGTAKKIKVWDALSDASISFGNSEPVDNVFYVIENDLIMAAVTEEVKKCANVNVLYNAKVECYDLPEYHEKQVKIKLANGDTYSCDLLLGCDGVNSSVRKAMQVDYLSWNYDQMGIVATLKFCEEFNNDIAYQRFLPTGPVALLPLTNTMSSLVWSTTPEEAKRLLHLTNEEFVDEVNRAVWCTYNRSSTVLQVTSAFDALLGVLNCSSDDIRQFPPKIKEVEEASRAAFPLGFGHSNCYIGKGVALVGDAAHRVHPLAGQGVNLGFGDVACLNTVLGNAVYSGSSLANFNYLKDYESQRQKYNVPTMLAVEGLHRLYTTDLTPVVLLRSLGLQATQALGPLKRLIMSQAAG